ncbi:MAG TPA: glycosyl hydrolase [Anditalea sp.]|nr:glycosyl hydrolase [Anditalea sp.]
MVNLIFRIIVVSAILGSGILLLVFINYAGVKISAPTEYLIASISNKITAIETKYIMTKRGHSRNKELNWLGNYKNMPSTLSDPEHFLLGAYDNQATKNFKTIVALEDSLRTVFPLIHIYTSWGSKKEQRFPAAEVNDINVLGSIPLITWEPWLIDFELETLNFRVGSNLSSIALGLFDNYIDNWAIEAKAFEHPIFLRLGHEMNDPYRYPWGPQNNSPEDYISAWKHVVDRFRAAGANNILWVWSPHPAYGDFEAYYPGDEYVDWVGTTTLNYGEVASWSNWWSFSEIFDKPYKDLSKYKKPIILAEFGSVAVGGNRANWYKEALSDFPSKYPLVKSLVFFHNSQDATITKKPLNWEIQNDPRVIQEIAKAIESWGAEEVFLNNINKTVTNLN